MTSTSFAELGLSDPIVRALVGLGHTEPTAVQSASITAILRGSDLWASSATGSGKTGAFGVPIVQALSGSRRGPPRTAHALILEPTRELAMQVADAIQSYGRFLPVRLGTCLAVGGVSINPQMMALRGGTDIVVATPGRLLDLVEQSALDLSHVEILVLDEADRMLSRGFEGELQRIASLLPAARQTLLFSATLPPRVQALADQLLSSPHRVNVDAGATPGADFLEQRAILVDEARRTALLRHLLETHEWSRVLVFVASQHAALHVAQKLSRSEPRVASLHGGLSQGARTAALASFKAGRVRVLVATDLAARGLDVTGLSAVVNYDLPRSPSDYVHRVGRTARAGETGVAVSFVSAENAAHFALIERRHALSIARE